MTELLGQVSFFSHIDESSLAEKRASSGQTITKIVCQFSGCVVSRNVWLRCFRGLDSVSLRYRAASNFATLEFLKIIRILQTRFVVLDYAPSSRAGSNRKLRQSEPCPVTLMLTETIQKQNYSSTIQKHLLLRADPRLTHITHAQKAIQYSLAKNEVSLYCD